MTGVAGQHPVAAPCRRCTGYGDGHYLTCPTLRLPVTDIRLRLASAARLAGRIERAAQALASDALRPGEFCGCPGDTHLLTCRTREVTVNATAARQSRYEHYDP